MASPFLYFVDERLSRAELTAACLDGDLVALGDAYMPADAVETAALRAGSLAETLGEVLAATHLTAAWIHGGLPVPPSRHTVQRAVPRRLNLAPDRRVVYRDLQVADADLQRLGGVMVTTPERTLADLARTGDDEHVQAARLLADVDHAVLGRAMQRLAAGSLPYKRAALARLREIAATGQEEVTR